MSDKEISDEKIEEVYENMLDTIEEHRETDRFVTQVNVERFDPVIDSDNSNEINLFLKDGTFDTSQADCIDIILKNVESVALHSIYSGHDQIAFKVVQSEKKGYFRNPLVRIVRDSIMQIKSVEPNVKGTEYIIAYEKLSDERMKVHRDSVEIKDDGTVDLSTLNEDLRLVEGQVKRILKQVYGRERFVE